eukprot:SAG11_NODE_237_length_11835_cov_11.023347_7_plen_83_part_00
MRANGKFCALDGSTTMILASQYQIKKDTRSILAKCPEIALSPRGLHPVAHKLDWLGGILFQKRYTQQFLNLRNRHIHDDYAL